MAAFNRAIFLHAISGTRPISDATAQLDNLESEIQAWASPGAARGKKKVVSVVEPSVPVWASSATSVSEVLVGLALAATLSANDGGSKVFEDVACKAAKLLSELCYSRSGYRPEIVRQAMERLV